MHHRRELPGIHVLRLGASLVIAAFHAERGGIAAAYLPALGTLAGPSSVAPSLTSLFLTISGFGLFYADATRDQARQRTAREFWSARASRLVPLMLVGHLIVAPFDLVGATRFGGVEAGVRGLLAATATQSWYPPYALSFDAPAWTLSVLAFGYLLYPWLAKRVSAISARTAAGLLVALWTGSIVLSRAILLASHGPADTDSLAHGFAHVFPPIRVLEFVSGVVLGRFWVATKGRFGATWALVALVPGALLVAALAGGLLEPRPAGHLGYGGLMPLWWVLIWAIAAISLAPGRARWSQLMGRASFAVYILHLPLLVMLNAMLHRGWFGAYGGLALALWFVSLVPMGLAAERWFVAPIARRLQPARPEQAPRPARRARMHAVPGGTAPGTAHKPRVGAGDR